MIQPTLKPPRWLIDLKAAALIAPLVIILVCVPFFYVATQPQPLDNQTALLIIGGPLAILGLIWLGGTLFLQRRDLQQQTSWLDDAFAPFGMKGEPYLNRAGRRFAGLWGGRQVEILFQQAQLFEWRLSTSLRGRWLISNQEPDDLLTVVLDPLTFAQRRLYAYGSFALRLANRETAVALVQQLLFSDSPFATRTLELRNGRLIFAQTEYNALQEFHPSAEQTTQIMTNLHQLLDFAESLT